MASLGSIVGVIKYLNIIFQFLKFPTGGNYESYSDYWLERAKTEKTLPARVRITKSTPYGHEAVVTRRLLGKINFPALSKLPENYLGRKYYEHIHHLNLKPYYFDSTRFPSEEQYFLGHLHETHDIFHVITGFNTTLEGEAGLQGFCYGQNPGRGALILLATFLLHRAKWDYQNGFSLFKEFYRGYLMGTSARSLFGVDWTKLWSVPLAEIRAEFNVTPVTTIESSILPLDEGFVSGLVSLPSSSLGVERPSIG